MAKKIVEQPPITGLDLLDISFLGLNIPNNYQDPVYPFEVEDIAFKITTDLFSQPEYLLKVALQVNCFIKLESQESSQKQADSDAEDAKDDEVHDLEAIASAEFIFKVLSTSKKKDFKTAMLSDEQRHMAAAISYSTMRGMLFTRAAGTLLDEVILPVMSPVVLLTPRIKEETAQ